MRSRVSAGLGVLGLGLLAVPSALADTAVLRGMRPVGLTAPPLTVMPHADMIERVAEQMGLGAVKVEWIAQGKTSPTEALAAGQADLAAAEVTSFVIAADTSAGTPGEVRALAALAERPYVLVARKDGINTIRD